jgi:hypothetical protein
MDKKQMYVQVVNLETGKVFSLPTLYTDRVEACVCGQNYVRDRQAEDRFSPLFFRVLISYDGKVAEPFNFYNDEEEELHLICDEDEYDGECECCDLCCEDEDEEDSEEPDYRELMEGILEVCEEFGVNLVVPRT